MKQKKLTKLVLNKETIATLERSDMKDLFGGAGRMPINEKSIGDCKVSLNMGMCTQVCIEKRNVFTEIAEPYCGH